MTLAAQVSTSIDPATVQDSALMLVEEGGTSKKGSILQVAAMLAPRIEILESLYRIPSGGNSVAALRAAIASAHITKGTVEMDPGTHIVDDPVFLTGLADSTYDAAGIFQTMRLRGRGMGYADNTGGLTVTLVDHSALKDRPAFCIQRGRAVELSDFQMIGPNGSAILNGYNEPTNVIADYVPVDLSNNRYAPQCAIAIDPKGTSAHPNGPGDRYPGFNYTLTTNASTYIANIRNVLMRKNVIGIMVVSSPTITQASSIGLDNVHSTESYVGFASGQSQARNFRWLNTNISRCMIGFDAKSYGLQQGAAPQIKEGEWGYLHSAFAMESSYGTPLVLNGVSMESIKTLGIISAGLSSTHTPALFNGVRCQLENFGWTAGPYLIRSGSVIKMTGCEFSRPILWVGNNTQLDNQYDFYGGSRSGGVDGPGGGRNLWQLDASCKFGQGNVGGINGFSTLRFFDHTGVAFASQPTETWDNIGCNHFTI